MEKFLLALLLSISAFAQQPKVKDQGEYDLYKSILQAQNDPHKQLQLLNTWKEKYPDTEFKQVRADLFAQDYLALNQPAQAIKAAQEALSVNSQDATALINIVRAAPYVQPSTPESQNAGETAANAVIDNWDKLKPAQVSDADWAKAKTEIGPAAQYTLGWSKIMQKDYASAEKPLKCVLATAGNPLVQYGLAAYWLGTALYNQTKVSEALYEIARAVTYTGPGALDRTTRDKAASFLQNAYEGYHGSAEGLDELKQLTSKSALPPDNFTIKSIKQIEEERPPEDPKITLWRSIRTALQAGDGAAYFDEKMKDTVIPQFKAKVVSQPNPKQLLVAVDDPSGDATLIFESPFRGAIEPGLEIEFSGVATAFTKMPYHLELRVDRKDIAGLPSPGPSRNR